MDTVLRDLIGKVFMVYLDDIVKFSANQEEHIQNQNQNSIYLNHIYIYTKEIFKHD